MKTIISISIFLFTMTALPAFGGIPNSQSQVVVHTVKKGQTLSGIAALHGTSVWDVKTSNALQADKIFPKQKLLITSRPYRAIASWYGP